MQPNSEHQQHDADFRELAGDFDIGDVSGRKRPDQDTGQQVADKRWHTKPHRDEAHDERKTQRGGEGSDEWKLVRHGGDAGQLV